LNFKSTSSEFGTDAARKINNEWHRAIFESKIPMKCAEMGIEFLKCNPAYTSFVGNLHYNFNDPACAAVEIARRSDYKTSKSWEFPIVTDSNWHTVQSAILKNGGEDIASPQTVTWQFLYNAARKTPKWRWRRQFRDVQLKSEIVGSLTKNSGISCINYITFA
jgi:hypothetical protein